MRGLFVLSLVCALGSCNSLLVVTGDGEGLPCQETQDCAQGLECRDSHCERPLMGDGGSGDGSMSSCTEAVDCAASCSNVVCYDRCGDGLCDRIKQRWLAYKVCVATAISGSCSTACNAGIGLVGCRTCANNLCEADLQNCLNESC